MQLACLPTECQRCITLTEHCQISQSCTGARMTSRPGLHGPWRRGYSSPRTLTAECPTLSAINRERSDKYLSQVLFQVCISFWESPQDII